MVVLRAPILLPGLNRLMRMHFRDRKRMQEEVTMALMCCNTAEQRRPIEGPVRVTYTRIYARLPLDCDNAAASAKFALDALQHLGVLPDDGPRVIVEYVVRQRKVATVKEEGFTLEIEPLEDKP